MGDDYKNSMQAEICGGGRTVASVQTTSAYDG